MGFALSCVAWFFHMLITTFAILFATALIDVVLYLSLGDVVECYRCHAQYRGLDDMTTHEPFDLEIHERHRQVQARLALSATVASEGTAVLERIRIFRSRKSSFSPGI